MWFTKIRRRVRIFYQQYTDSAPSQNSMIVVSDARSRVVDYSDIYEYSYDYSTYSSSVDGYDAEGQLTSALQYVTKADSELPVIYEITGHGKYPFRRFFGGG